MASLNRPKTNVDTKTILIHAIILGEPLTAFQFTNSLMGKRHLFETVEIDLNWNFDIKIEFQGIEVSFEQMQSTD